MFAIELFLTEKGEENLDQVMRIVYAVINTLKTKEIDEYMADELEQMCRLKFNYKHKDGISKFAIKTANNMHQLLEKGIDMSQIIRYPYMLDDFEPKAITGLINEMTAQNMLIFYSSKKNNDTADLLDEIYQTKYSREDIDPELIERLNSANFTEIEAEITQEFMPYWKMPPQNNFIPYDCKSLSCDEPQEYRNVPLDNARF